MKSLINSLINWFLYDNDLRHERVKEFIDLINSIISFRIFSTLKHLPFFKAKLVSYSIKVRSHCNFLKPFLVYVVNKKERAIAGLIFRFFTLPPDSG